MKRTKFSQMLKAERTRLRHSQVQVADWLSMTQSAYSRMEKGITNPGVARSVEIIKILETRGYVGIQPIELEEIDGVPSITFRWPFHKYWLYALIAVVILMAIDYVANMPDDYARGLAAAQSDEPVPDKTSGFIFLAIVTGAIFYGLYRLVRRWRWQP